MIAGIGMGLFFAPIANVVLSAVRPIEEGQASGATTPSARSAACSGWRVARQRLLVGRLVPVARAFVDGLLPAVWSARRSSRVGAVVALALPGRIRREAHRSGPGDGSARLPRRSRPPAPNPG